MILDSSAVLAVLLDEPGGDRVLEALADATPIGIGTPTLAEAGIVLASRVGPGGRAHLGRFMAELEAEEIPFLDEHWPVAVDAFLRYGKGRHPAGLNFGDCLTYAVARTAGEALLCLGDDFPQTDLDVVVPRRR